LAQWQQAKRIGKDPKQIKAVFQECWSASDTQGYFANALKEQGYVIARGDRRG
jgi:F420-0:gamma-glutamyl ligase